PPSGHHQDLASIPQPQGRRGGPASQDQDRGRDCVHQDDLASPGCSVWKCAVRARRRSSRGRRGRPQEDDGDCGRAPAL
ncbi:hypothetical protein OC846_005882, partial [Tilletia horrida]